MPCCAAARRSPRGGPREQVFRWASVTKPVTALATLVAAEEGILDLDDPGRARPARRCGICWRTRRGCPSRGGRRSRSRASGGATRTPASTSWPRSSARRRRCRSPSICERPSSGRWSCGQSCAARPARAARQPRRPAATGREFQRPRLIAPETLAEATSVQFPGLVGVLPDIGRMDPNDWGLGVELRDGKQPHWTGSHNSPRTFGHYGSSGTFLWVDPEADTALALSDRPRLRSLGARGLAAVVRRRSHEPLRKRLHTEGPS